VIQSYLMPFQIEAIVGNAPGRKQMAISLMTVAGNIGSMSGPIWGSLSDKLVDRNGRRMRRPIIVFGQILFCGSCLGIANTEPGGIFKTFPWFMFFYMLFTLTANISGAPCECLPTL
jgi:MFS family permease